jgi:prolyl-tRNA editing enzyme YbaK/EbsC (Cys-tRNA(Pro) deacylase)
MWSITQEVEAMTKQLSPNAQRVQDALRQHGVMCEVVELSQSTRTAKEAADAIGCGVAQIAKSLVFKAKHTKRPILVIASGVNRVDEKKVAQFIGEPIEKADADFVRKRTGFAIGGVAPVGHLEKIETFIDEDLFGYEEIWAAAGTPHAVFRLTPGELKKLTGGRITSIT